MAALIAAASIAATQDRPQFRARVDLVEVDVVAMDDAGTIVAGLTRDDFDVREDGGSVEIKSFVPAVADTATTESEGRFVVLLLDDLVTSRMLTARIKLVAHQFAERMGPHDVVAVAQMNGSASVTTNDRGQISAAIDRFEYHGNRAMPGASLARQSLDVIGSLAKQLSEVHHRRKTLVCIGSPALFMATEPAGRAGTEYSSNWTESVKQASRANVSVYEIDPAGLTGFRPDGGLAFTEETGGTAFFTNEFDKAVDRIWSEAGHYYLLGYEPPSRDRTLHRIDVRVKRPHVAIRARRTRS
jgi:hypothetical protein